MSDMLKFAKSSNPKELETLLKTSGANILIISDTHGNIQAIKQLLENYHGLIKAVVHLGDNARDIIRIAGTAVKSNMYHIVNGNTDPEVAAYNERVIEIAGKRIFITHGHRYNVKSGLDMLIYRARELQVDACLFGHTHKQTLFTQNGIVFINPGSLSFPHMGTDKGYGFLSISEKGDIKGKLLTYQEAVWQEE